MIFLIVGKPRSGKSFYFVTKVVDKIRAQAKAKNKHFRLISNIRGHVDADELIDFQSDFMSREYDNATIVLDEVQYFSSRDTNSRMFQHFTTHGHQGRNYYWITQSVAAIPRKWQGLVEQTIKIEPVAGSSVSRAITFLGIPKKGDMPIFSETFRPSATDRYQTVEDGADIPKRKMPLKVWMLLGACVSTAIFAPLGAYLVYDKFTAGSVVTKLSNDKVAQLNQSELRQPVSLKPKMPLNDKKSSDTVSDEGAQRRSSSPSVAQALPKFRPSDLVGCYATPTICACQKSDGTDAGYDLSQCMSELHIDHLPPLTAPKPHLTDRQRFFAYRLAEFRRLHPYWSLAKARKWVGGGIQDYVD